MKNNMIKKMKNVKVTFYQTPSYERYLVAGVDSKHKAIFGVEAEVTRARRGFGGGKWTPWTVSFPSCNGPLGFMEQRVAVINKALAIAKRLAKKDDRHD